MSDTIRVYNPKPVQIWYDTFTTKSGFEVKKKSQVEMAYTEYFLDGTVVATGTEDFSPERKKAEIDHVEVWTWDGISLNRGGHRKFEKESSYLISRKQRKEFKEFCERKYHKAQLVQLRTV